MLTLLTAYRFGIHKKARKKCKRLLFNYRLMRTFKNSVPFSVIKAVRLTAGRKIPINPKHLFRPRRML